MRLSIIAITFTILSAAAFAAAPQGSCYAPCSQYSCYDVLAPDFQCPGELRAIRGWCPGGNNIQCCAPAGTPIGPIFNVQIKQQIERGEYSACGTAAATGATSGATQTTTATSPAPSGTPTQSSSSGSARPSRSYAGAACFAPCDEYRCVDVSATSRCPPGTRTVRGWCPGGNNIQCCAPEGTPTGPKFSEKVKTGVLSGAVTSCGPEAAKEAESGSATSNIKRGDFTVKVDGDSGCRYWVESNGVKTKEASVECGTEVVIKVGPGGDCRDEGLYICKVWSSDEFSAQPILEGAFTIDWSDPTDIPKPRKYEFVFDKASPPLLKDPGKLEDSLKALFDSHKIKIVFETINTLGPPTELNSKFISRNYGLASSGIPALNILVVYAKKENKIYVAHSKDCGFSEGALEAAVNRQQVEEKIKVRDYDGAFQLLASDLSKIAVSARNSVGRCEAKKEKDCWGECKGLLSSCTQEKCRSLGCNWNKKYAVCLDVDFHESESTIQERLDAVKNGFRGFIYRDPVCTGANCAGYVNRAHEYIFGIGKGFITGVAGGAWRMPQAIKERKGIVKFYDWRNGEIFTDYDSLQPGDVIGFYYSISNFRPEIAYQDDNEDRKYTGAERGNTKDIDFTHVALYLGKKGNKHIITHLFHPETCRSCEPVRIEPIETFLKEFGSGREFFRVRAVMKPDHERLYRIPPKAGEIDFRTHTVKKGDNLAGIANSDEALMWLIAHYNMLVENKNMERYEGKVILIPTAVPAGYKYEPLKPEDIERETLEKALAKLIQQRKDDENSRGNLNFAKDLSLQAWARTIIKKAPDKSIETIALIATVIDLETNFQLDVLSKKKEKFLGFEIEIDEGLARAVDIELLGTNFKTYSVGCMNTQLCKAEAIAKESGKPSDTRAVYSELKTIDGCFFYGLEMLKRIKAAYNIVPGAGLDNRNVLTIMSDHVRGIFFIRNTRLQVKINDLLLAKNSNVLINDIDGDFQAYDRCKLQASVTNSELAVRNLARLYGLQISEKEIRDSLAFEKEKRFESTKLYREIERLWNEHATRQKDIELGTLGNSITSNIIEVPESSDILQVSASQTVRSTDQIEIKSSMKSVAHVKYHVITAKIIDENGLEGNEIKKDCGKNLFCTAYIDIPPHIKSGIVQYWSDVALSDGKTIRDPVKGVKRVEISDYHYCDEPYTTSLCLELNADKCLNGEFMPGYCKKDPQEIMCCVTADKLRQGEGKEPIAVLSLIGGQLKGALNRAGAMTELGKILCSEIRWELIDDKLLRVVNSGLGNKFSVAVKPGTYFAAFSCYDDRTKTFDELHPEFWEEFTKRGSPFYWTIYRYQHYMDGLQEAMKAEGARSVLFIPVFKSASPLSPNYNEFISVVDNNYNFFLNALPKSCRAKFIKTMPKINTFDGFKKTPACPTDPEAMRELAKQYGYDPSKFEIIVGVGSDRGDMGSAVTGEAKCLAYETRKEEDVGKGLIWIALSDDEAVLAHEIGHLFLLDEQYCSRDAGHPNLLCSGSDSVNPLSVEFGCDPLAKSGPNVCCGRAAGFAQDCSEPQGGICCLGNRVGGARSIMSFGKTASGGFDPNEIENFQDVLGC